MYTQELNGEMAVELLPEEWFSGVNTGDVLVTDDEGRVYTINFERSAMFVAEIPVEQPKRFNTDGLLELLE